MITYYLRIHMNDCATKLNGKQHEAVTAKAQNILVIAGAGSGKTNVLVNRIAYVIENQNVSPNNILAVTFTNKAAAEMRNRVEEILDHPITGMWIGTFHSLCHRILRQHYAAANLPKQFQILDQDDQSKLIKKIHAAMNLDEERWPAKKSQSFINKNKDNGITCDEIKSKGNPNTETLITIYKNYQAQCNISGAVDFADLIMRTYHMLASNAEIRHHYQHKFSFLLVDEFQDINNIQYMWLKILSGVDEGTTSSTVMAVGDDDQSIYSWRGAEIAHILSFSKDFPETKTIRLEQNYRSTGNILEAANAVIANNNDRLGKSLWTEGNAGSPIYIYNSINDIDEAIFIASKIKEWQLQSSRTDKVAILYRSNAQSRIIEDVLNRNQMPYRVYGGLRFFDRAEIKDALGYMRLVNNLHDNAAYDRIINQPTRGVGRQTLEQIRAYANAAEVSLWQATEEILATDELTARAATALRKFIDLITGLQHEVATKSIADAAALILEQSGLIELYRKDKKDNAQAKVENLQELLNAAESFGNNDSEATLANFLAYSILDTSATKEDQSASAIDLMTLHASKGLEYSLVFLTGLEEGLFPHKMSMIEPNNLAEERRLCYVGITRAREKLFITHASSRRIHGKTSYQSPSRFLHEIPPNLTQEIVNSAQAPRYSSKPSHSMQPTYKLPKETNTNPNSYFLGQRVLHAKFGEGVVINYEGDKATGRVQIKFKSQDAKWLLASYAKLQSLD
jgi:DNA helicase II / ATP-dependent DNA helicase PcrA